MKEVVRLPTLGNGELIVRRDKVLAIADSDIPAEGGTWCVLYLDRIKESAFYVNLSAVQAAGKLWGET